MNPRLQYWKTRMCAELGVEPYTVCDDIRAVFGFAPIIDGVPADEFAEMMVSLSVPDEWPERAVDLAVRRFFLRAFSTARVYSRDRNASVFERLASEINPAPTEPAP